MFDPLLDFIGQVDFWHWWVLACGLLAIELLFLGDFLLLWLGIAAAFTGIFHLIFPNLPPAGIVGIFSILSLVSAWAWYTLSRRRKNPSDHPTLNRRGHQYIGRTFTLDAPIENQYGKLHVDDTTWRVCAKEDSPAGTKVRVIGTEGTTLKVDPIDSDSK
ncbi:MAG: NfeD family protein [bacterium]|nr:NfeD family protein [bacterium]